MTQYGRSPWTDRFPRSRVPSYPRLRGRHEIDVVVIGGGLTGCATAYAFAAAGIKVALIEAAQIGRGASALSTGWISDDPGASFAAAEQLIGRRAARHAWQSWRRAALDFTALIRRLDVKCQLEPRPTLIAATTPEQAAQLKREQKVRKEAGLDAPSLNAKAILAEAAIQAAGGIRTRDGATIDPYRAAIGLAAAAADRGAQIFERTAARRTKFGRRTADVVLDDGSIRTRRIVVATGRPTALFKSLIRHFWFKSSFLALTAPIPAKVRNQLGRREVVVRDLAQPPHVVRWVDDERLLVSGADDAERPAAAAREDDRAAHRSVDVRAVDDLSRDLRHPAGVRLGGAVRANGGRPALHRSAPQLPASSVRVRRREPQRDRRLSRQPHAPAPSPRRGRSGGRGVRVQPIRSCPVDLLVFGPHPDDIEIGLGGTIARQAARRPRASGLCDLTAGRWAATARSRSGWRKPRRRALVLGAAWRENLRWPDRRIGSDPGHIEQRCGVHPPASAADRGDSVLVRSASRSRGGERTC